MAFDSAVNAVGYAHAMGDYSMMMAKEWDTENL
jgi:hypothetical protein